MHNTTLHYTNYITLHYITLHILLQLQLQLQPQPQLQGTTTTTLRYATLITLHYNYNYTILHWTTLYHTTVHNATVHYTTLHQIHHTTYPTPPLQLQLELHYANYATSQLQLHYTTLQLQLQLRYTTLHPGVVVRWPLQPLQQLQKTQLQAPFGPSVDSLCGPWFTTTNLSYRFPIFETSATALCSTTGDHTEANGSPETKFIPNSGRLVNTMHQLINLHRCWESVSTIRSAWFYFVPFGTNHEESRLENCRFWLGFTTFQKH